MQAGPPDPVRPPDAHKDERGDCGHERGRPPPLSARGHHRRDRGHRHDHEPVLRPHGTRHERLGAVGDPAQPADQIARVEHLRVRDLAVLRVHAVCVQPQLPGYGHGDCADACQHCGAPPLPAGRDRQHDEQRHHERSALALGGQGGGGEERAQGQGLRAPVAEPPPRPYRGHREEHRHGDVRQGGARLRGHPRRHRQQQHSRPHERRRHPVAQERGEREEQGHHHERRLDVHHLRVQRAHEAEVDRLEPGQEQGVVEVQQAIAGAREHVRVEPAQQHDRAGLHRPHRPCIPLGQGPVQGVDQEQGADCRHGPGHGDHGPSLGGDGTAPGQQGHPGRRQQHPGRGDQGAAGDHLPGLKRQPRHERPRRGHARRREPDHVEEGDPAGNLAGRAPQAKRAAEADARREEACIRCCEPGEVKDHVAVWMAQTPGLSGVAPLGAVRRPVLPHDEPVGGGTASDRRCAGAVT